jgi:hypothetical protein
MATPSLVAPGIGKVQVEADPSWRFAVDDQAEVGLSVVSDVDRAAIEIEVHGQWSRQLCLTVYHTLRNCMAECPSAIIIDLQGLKDLNAASTTMWLAASRAANTLRPPAHLVLSVPPTRQLTSHLRRLGAVRFLPIYATVSQARAAVATRLPFTHWLHLDRLRPRPDSAEVAADAVAVACAAWRRPELVEPGRQIVTELVSNAVVHARTDVALTMSLRGTRLHLAVRDGDGRLPCLLHPTPTGHGMTPWMLGPGLQMVDSQACAWGARPTRDGKVVWAIVEARREAQQG